MTLLTIVVLNWNRQSLAGISENATLKLRNITIHREDLFLRLLLHDSPGNFTTILNGFMYDLSGQFKAVSSTGLYDILIDTCNFCVPF